MILQQLQQDADRLVGDLPPSMYDTKAVRWIVHLDAAGRFQGIQPTSGGGKKDKGKPMLVPFKTRTSAVRPLLLVDKVTYTWGLPLEHRRAAEEHAAYVELLDRCARETGNSDVAAVAAFVGAWDPTRTPVPSEMLPDELTTFAVEGRLPIDDPVVRAFWAREAGGEEDSGTPGQCLVCGSETRVVERLPVVVKGLPRGQSSGVAIVSANASAFESYGRAAALTSPTCQPCAERFGKAANALLQDSRKHLNIGPVAYLFWAPGTEWDFVDFLANPDPEQVRNLLLAPSRGSLPAVEEAPFYATSLTANVSRMVVRSWLHTTVGTARRSLVRWFRLQRLVASDGGEGAPLSIWRLAASLYRDGKDIVARVPDALLQVALHGGSLPDWLLRQAVLRNQAERGVTYPRATLIKAALCSHPTEEGDPDRMAALNPETRSPAYHCGRLLAELEEIQRLAVPGIKATLVDRYYAGASTAPARVFGTLLSGAQAHLGKLRKERPGAHARLAERLEQILAELEGFPATLTLRDQALFSLGYYHQRAHDRAARKDAAETRRARADAAANATEEEEDE